MLKTSQQNKGRGSKHMKKIKNIQARRLKCDPLRSDLCDQTCDNCSWRETCNCGGSGLIQLTCLKEKLCGGKREGEMRERFEPWMNHPFPLLSPPFLTRLGWWLIAGTKGNPGGSVLRSLHRPQTHYRSPWCKTAFHAGAGSGLAKGHVNHTENQTQSCSRIRRRYDQELWSTVPVLTEAPPHDGLFHWEN